MQKRDAKHPRETSGRSAGPPEPERAARPANADERAFLVLDPHLRSPFLTPAYDAVSAVTDTTPSPLYTRVVPSQRRTPSAKVPRGYPIPRPRSPPPVALHPSSMTYGTRRTSAQVRSNFATPGPASRTNPEPKQSTPIPIAPTSGTSPLPTNSPLSSSQGKTRRPSQTSLARRRLSASNGARPSSLPNGGRGGALGLVGMEDGDDGEVKGSVGRKEKGQLFECEKCRKVRPCLSRLGGCGARGERRGTGS